MMKDYNQKRCDLRRLVKTYYDLQYLHTRLNNRLGFKKDGSMQNIDDREFQLTDYDKYIEILDFADSRMNEMFKTIEKALSEFPVYTEWLISITGIDVLMGGIICSEYDIYKMDTVSNAISFTGLAPGKDRLIKGQRAPFNQWLRSKMIGVLARGFIMSKSYYVKFYYNLHVPLLRREELGIGRLDVSESIYEKTGKMWKEESEGHRSNYAKRYMIKMFLQDLYVAWRTLEGLPVREPYSEEYLGKKHSE